MKEQLIFQTIITIVNSILTEYLLLVTLVVEMFIFFKYPGELKKKLQKSFFQTWYQ